MIFVDTWAWVALALKLDQHHSKAKRAHKQLLRAKRQYVTTDYVLSEVIGSCPFCDATADFGRNRDPFSCKTRGLRSKTLTIRDISRHRMDSYGHRPSVHHAGRKPGTIVREFHLGGGRSGNLPTRSCVPCAIPPSLAVAAEVSRQTGHFIRRFHQHDRYAGTRHW